MKKTIFTIMTLILSTSAFAQPAGGPGGAGAAGGMPSNEVIMERNDVNDDGVITREEAEASETQLGANFAMFDTDEDGEVTEEELDSVREGMGGGAAPAQ